MQRDGRRGLARRHERQAVRDARHRAEPRGRHARQVAGGVAVAGARDEHDVERPQGRREASLRQAPPLRDTGPQPSAHANRSPASSGYANANTTPSRGTRSTRSAIETALPRRPLQVVARAVVRVHAARSARPARLPPGPSPRRGSPSRGTPRAAGRGSSRSASVSASALSTASARPAGPVEIGAEQVARLARGRRRRGRARRGAARPSRGDSRTAAAPRPRRFRAQGGRTAQSLPALRARYRADGGRGASSTSQLVRSSPLSSSCTP